MDGVEEKSNEISDSITDRNTAGTMFIDTIAPSVIFRNANTEIDKSAKSVKLVFDVTDKYYSSENTDLS